MRIDWGQWRIFEARPEPVPFDSEDSLETLERRALSGFRLRRSRQDMYSVILPAAVLFAAIVLFRLFFGEDLHTVLCAFMYHSICEMAGSLF